MAVSEWQAAEDRRDTALRELRPNDAYKGTSASCEEIDAAFLAEFIPEHEWACGQVVEVNTGEPERQSGVITGEPIGGRVMILFEDGVHWSYPTTRCYVRRTDQ